jgi:hypothetical protein
MTDNLVKDLRNSGWYFGKPAADRIEKLEAALKPFLQLPIGVVANDPPEMEVYQCHGWPKDESAVVTVADFRRARKAMEVKEPLEWTENYGQGSEPWLKDEEK